MSNNETNNLARIILDNNQNYLNNEFLIENRIIDNVLQDSFNEKNPIKYIINDNAKKSIIFEKFNFKKHNIKCCPIFLTEFNNDSEIAILPCKHIFNKIAIMKWLEEEDYHCPTCRFKFEFKEKKSENQEFQSSPQLNFSNIPNEPSLFDFILHRVEEHIEQRQIESIILESFNQNNFNYNSDDNNN